MLIIYYFLAYIVTKLDSNHVTVLGEYCVKTIIFKQHNIHSIKKHV